MPPSSRARDRAPLEVLIVDDDEMLAEFIGFALEELGCRPRYAETGVKALAMLDNQVDLLVTDWQMPEMDGMELVQKVRQQGDPDNHLHIAMMTGREDSGAMYAALQAGVDDFLYKPVDAVQLQMAVASARRNRLLHSRLRRRNDLLAAAHERTREALRRVRADLDAAADLHERLLPQTGRLAGVAIEHLYRPALRLGGDTIGASDLGEGKALFFVIDVRGHGVPAALESFHLHHRLNQFRPTGPDALREAAETLNREICARGDESYATLIAGVIDAPGRRGWLLRAGHPPPLFITGTQVVEVEQAGSMPLGWFEDAEFAVHAFAFDTGTRLVVYSDGVTERLDDSGNELGSAGLARLLVDSAGQPLADVVGRIEEALNLGKAGRDLEDDVSVLAIERVQAD